MAAVDFVAAGMQADGNAVVVAGGMQSAVLSSCILYLACPCSAKVCPLIHAERFVAGAFLASMPLRCCF